VRYRGCEIAPLPYRLFRSGRWTVDLEVWRGVRRLPYTVREFYLTEREATARCIQVGRRIVDGKMPGVTLPWRRPSRVRQAVRVAAKLVLIAGTVFLLLALVQAPLFRF
jgi:hypothetical protein